MNEFAKDEDFVKAHAEPLPFTSPTPTGEWITFKCIDGKDGKAFVTNMQKYPKNIVFMFHEWWGLNDYIKQEAERLASKLNVTVVAIDLYDGKVATTREEAQKYVQSVQEARALAIIGGAYDHFPVEAHYITIGWCFGGGWSMQAALTPAPLKADDERIQGCIIYYGSPETNPEKLARLHCPVLGIFGSKDKWLTPQVVSEFEESMKKAKKKLTVKSYDADHGFANPSNPNHDKAATEDARTHADEFIRTRFGLK
jgi:carboxymethylenebutenolidase